MMVIALTGFEPGSLLFRGAEMISYSRWISLFWSAGTRFDIKRIAHDLRIYMHILFQVIIGVKHQRARHGQLGNDNKQPSPERDLVSETKIQKPFHRSLLAHIIYLTISSAETIANATETCRVNI